MLTNRCCAIGGVAVLVTLLWVQAAPADSQAEIARSGSAPAVTLDRSRIAQLPRYSASGTHQCESASGRGSCVVTGEFSNCLDASSSLMTRDCCPTTRSGGKSSGFALNYCISEPERR
jgi:hypothetical protein